MQSQRCELKISQHLSKFYWIEKHNPWNYFLCVSRKKSKVCVCLLGFADWLQIPQLRARDPSGFVLSLTDDYSKSLTYSMCSHQFGFWNTMSQWSGQTCSVVYLGDSEGPMLLVYLYVCMGWQEVWLTLNSDDAFWGAVLIRIDFIVLLL